MAALALVGAPRRLLVGFALGLFLWGGLASCEGSTGQTPVRETISATGVTLNRSTLSLTVGGSSVTLVATLLPANATNTAVTWSSSTPAVASVSTTGVVSPVTPGTATITVTTRDGAKVATCAVTVIPNIIAVTGISLDRNALDLVAGAEEVRLVATITPESATNQKVIWQSSNTAVATVSDSGGVAPKAPGTTSIIVKSADGSKAAICAVRVTAAPIAVSGILLDKSTLSLTVGSTAPALVATVKPVNATDTAISWSSNKPAVAEVDKDGVVAGKTEGEALITVTTHNGSFTATCSVTVIKPTNAVSGVTVAVKRLDLVVGAYASKLTATPLPANADNPAVTWSSSDKRVAKVSSEGIVTAVGSGTATITVKTVEGRFTDTCVVTVHSDTVTSVSATPQLTGQIAVTWADPLDPNTTGIQVTMLGADGSPSRIVQAGRKMIAFAGLTLGASYTFAIRVLGSSGTASDEVTTHSTPRQVVKVLRGQRRKAPSAELEAFYITDTYGSSATETHDIVIARRTEIENQDFPKNYRWNLMPALSDPTDPALVSFKNEQYTTKATGDGGTGHQWVETDRYLHVRPGGFSAEGQYYAWCTSGVPGVGIAHVAYADQIETEIADGEIADGGVDDATFRTHATFRMVSRPEVPDGGPEEPGATYFQWLGDKTGSSYITDMCFHLVAQDSAAIAQTNRPDPFEHDTAWFIEDVTTVEP